MRARVRHDSNLNRVRSAGIWWGPEWQIVPAHAEREIAVNPFLEIDPATTPAAQTPEDTATRLVINQPGSRKGNRKL